MNELIEEFLSTATCYDEDDTNTDEVELMLDRDGLGFTNCKMD